MCERQAGNVLSRGLKWILKRKSNQKWIFAPAEMNRNRILCLITLAAWGFLPFSGHAQSLKLGLYSEPVMTWMSSTDKEIKTRGNNLGLRMGVSGEYLFHTRWALVASTNLSINQGGPCSIKPEAISGWNQNLKHRTITWDKSRCRITAASPTRFNSGRPAWA